MDFDWTPRQRFTQSAVRDAIRDIFGESAKRTRTRPSASVVEDRTGMLLTAISPAGTVASSAKLAL